MAILARLGDTIYDPWANRVKKISSTLVAEEAEALRLLAIKEDISLASLVRRIIIKYINESCSNEEAQTESLKHTSERTDWSST